MKLSASLFVFTLLGVSALPAQWSTNPFQGGTNGTVHAVIGNRSSNLAIAGAFTNVGLLTSAQTSGFALFNGAGWQQFNGDYRCLDRNAGGTLAVGTAFPFRRVSTVTGGVFTQILPPFNYTSSGFWPLFASDVEAVVILDNGAVIAGGLLGPQFGPSGPSPGPGRPYQSHLLVAPPGANRFVSAFTPITVPTGQLVTALERSADGSGTVFVAGRNVNTANGITNLGTITVSGAGAITTAAFMPAPPVGLIIALNSMPNGDLVAAYDTGIVQRFNGTIWTNLNVQAALGATPTVECIIDLPDGDLVIGGQLNGGSMVARLTGATWSLLAAGGPGTVRGLTLLEDSALVAVGSFGTMNIGSTSASCGNIGALPVATVATATQAELGCVGSGGLNVLTANSLPYIGRPFSSTAAGLNPTGIVIMARGTAPATGPLGFPLLPGCKDHLIPITLDAVVAGMASVTFTLAVPDSVALIGQTLREQAYSFDDAFTTASTSNRLDVTFGDV